MDNEKNNFPSLDGDHLLGNLSLGDDFEERVFAGIKKKKAFRRNVTAAVLGFFLAGFLFTAHQLFLKNNSRQTYLATHESSSKLEEIPLVEEVTYAASDSHTDYIIEQVGYTTDDGSY